MKLRHLIISSTSALALAACGGSDNAGSTAGSTDSSASTSSSQASTARNDIRVVGSSTVYPFSTKVAQEFGNKTGHKVIVESTGSGGGHKLFCEGAGGGSADVTNSSRS